jgi:hypothetical protein
MPEVAAASNPRLPILDLRVGSVHAQTALSMWPCHAMKATVPGIAPAIRGSNMPQTGVRVRKRPYCRAVSPSEPRLPRGPSSQPGECGVCTPSSGGLTVSARALLRSRFPLVRFPIGNHSCFIYRLDELRDHHRSTGTVSSLNGRRCLQP